jgi:hypothetical protein
MIPTIQEKLQNHLIFLRGSGIDPATTGLQLQGTEVAELLDALGVPPPQPVPVEPTGTPVCIFCSQGHHPQCSGAWCTCICKASPGAP